MSEKGSRNALLKRAFCVETPDDHQVDRQDSQEDFAVDGIVASAADGRAEQTFEHGEVRLDLPPLAVEVGGPILGQRPAVRAAGKVVRVVRRPSAYGWDDAGDPQFVV